MNSTYSSKGINEISFLHRYKATFCVLLIIGLIVFIALQFIATLRAPDCTAKKRNLAIYFVSEIILVMLLRFCSKHLYNPFAKKHSEFTGVALVERINAQNKENDLAQSYQNYNLVDAL